MADGHQPPPSVGRWSELCGQWEAVYEKTCLGKAKGRVRASVPSPSHHEFTNLEALYVILFICYWIQFGSILFQIFTSVFKRNVGLYFSFPVMSLSGFDIRVVLA